METEKKTNKNTNRRYEVILWRKLQKICFKTLQKHN